MPLLISAALWLVSFVLALMPLTAYENEFFMGAIIALVASCIALLLSRTDMQVLCWQKSVAVSFAALWLVCLLSMVTSDIPFIALIYFMFFSAWPLSFILGVQYHQDQKTKTFLLSGLGVIFALLGVGALVQFFALPEWLFQGRRVNLPLADPNTLAGLMSLGLWGAIGLMLHGANRLQRNAGLALAVLLFCALMTTGSRGALLSLGVAFAVFAVANAALLRSHLRCLVGLGLGAATFIIIVIVVQGGVPLWNALVSGVINPAGMLSERPAIWAGAWTIFSNHPLTGTGIGTFFLYYREVRAGDFTSAGLMAHNDPLQFAAEMGLLAPLLFYILIALSLWHMAQRKAWVAFCAVLGVFLQAHVAHNFYTLPTLMLTGLIMAWGVGAGSRILRMNSLLCQGLAVVMLLALAVFVCAMGSEIILNRAQRDLLQGKYESYIADINFAGRLSMNQNGRVLVRAAEVPITLLQMPDKKLTRQERENNRRKAETLLDRAEAVNPRLPDINYNRALIARDSDQKQRLLQRSLAMDPLYLPARMKLADILLADQREAQGLAVLAAGLDWPYRTPQARDYFARTATLALERGNKDIQEKALRRLLSMTKKN